MNPTTVLLLGAGRMGGAMIDGWAVGGPVKVADLLIRDPHPGPEAQAAEIDGALLNPPDDVLGGAATVVLAVKPQMWREVAEAVAPHLAPDAVIVSIAAGVSIASLAEVFGARDIARVMPTTAVAICQGAASIFAHSEGARDRATDLFAGISETIDLEDEELMHAATAVSGSGPAYFYAFVEALEDAGIRAGLPERAAILMAQATVTGAAALMASGDMSPVDLREQVTSPGGTTQAALEVLMGEGGLTDLLNEAVVAAVRRSKELE
ncbi:MAG: pyrroline-5-carboxylate reductase [Caulobacterales bacterium]|nr:pyrroline-5-carboxylate reductase [Caulobacterales bacterium]